MAKEETVAPLEETIKATLEFEIENLVSRTDWGSINFDDAREDLDRIFAIINHLNILPLDYLTDQAVKQIHQALNQVNEVLEKLNGFSLDQGTPTQIRDQLIREVHQQADNFYTIATPWIPFLAYQKGDVAQNISAHCCPTNFHASTKACCGLGGPGSGGLASSSSIRGLRSNRLS